MFKKFFNMAAAALILASCSSNAAKNQDAADSNTGDSVKEMTPIDSTSVKVEVETTAGNFTILLYGDTPKHRDNFVKNVKEGVYDGTLFHRVIKNFMVQAGDPDSKTAQPGQQLGSGDLGYTVEAEINFPKHYHKRGVLAAARTGDNVNPERRSSASQFYVVTGQKVDDKQLEQLQMNATMNQLIEDHMDEIRHMYANKDQNGMKALEKQLFEQAETLIAEGKGTLTPAMIETYKTVGGAPHLDGQYTVYGEVISGMSTIDKIEAAETDRADRPTDDIRIISMKIVE